MPGSLPPPVNAKRTTSGRRRTALFFTMNSELQLKADNHETLVQQFKIRRISGSTRAIQSDYPLIDDTNQPKDGKSPLRFISYRNFRLLAQRETWIQHWKTATSPLVPGGIVSTAHRFFMFGVYLADDYVIRKGETSDEMFMINRGVCVLFDATELYKANGNIEYPAKTAAFPGFENLVDDKTTRSINNFLLPHGNAPLLKRPYREIVA